MTTIRKMLLNNYFWDEKLTPGNKKNDAANEFVIPSNINKASSTAKEPVLSITRGTAPKILVSEVIVILRTFSLTLNTTLLFFDSKI